MESVLGFELGFWDYATFVTGVLLGVSCILAYVWLAGLPGRIAESRNHPDAEAVKLLGWAGLLPTIVPWIQAFIWAFKPTNKVDILRFPPEEAKAIEAQRARLAETAAAHAKGGPGSDGPSPADPGGENSEETKQ